MMSRRIDDNAQNRGAEPLRQGEVAPQVIRRDSSRTDFDLYIRLLRQGLQIVLLCITKRVKRQIVGNLDEVDTQRGGPPNQRQGVHRLRGWWIAWNADVPGIGIRTNAEFHSGVSA